jgi:hypothetical protein
MDKEKSEVLAQLREDLRDVPRENQRIRGLGDVIHRVTSFLGFKHCSECEKRRERMNRWARLSKDDG